MRAGLLTLIFSLITLVCGFAQDAPLSKKAKDNFEKAQKAWQARQVGEAITYFEKVLDSDPGHYETNLRLAQIYELQKNIDLARKHFTKVTVIKPDAPQSAPAYQWLGRYHFEAARYDSALIYYQKSLGLLPPKSSLFRHAEKAVASSKFAMEALKNPVSISKKSMGDTVNFLETQYFPVLTADNETLIFTGLTPARDENIYITHRQKNERGTDHSAADRWDVPEEISASINTSNNEGTCSVSADGRTLVFTACNRQDGYGSCDLYITHKEGKTWSAPVNLGEPVNSRDWESQPSLSADGRMLYFASDRKGGQGKRDIWVSNLDSKKQWSSPKNLGPSINTPDEENAPFIHANGRTLFYASTGFPGMGGFDIFISQRTDTTWAAPKNLGYPINTVADQVGMFIASDGSRAYYTDDSKGRSLLYAFDLPQAVKELFVPTHYAKGRVFDKITGKPLQSDIDLFDLKTGSKVAEFTSDGTNGSFLAVLNHGSEYAFYVSKEGYLFKSLSFSVNDSASSVNLDIPLEAIEKDRAEILNNIFFETGAYRLDEKSRVELDKMIDFLKKNPGIRIEVSGHTDDVGSDKVNLDLSQKRAQSVLEYLEKSGVATARLTAKGYGKTKPVAPNDSDLNRQKNRRIEWRIL
ncbi:OmpA family protein [Dyadobacter sandarakinus]|uniref:OmpA family protein n=1 Tax=Dyadobacter sandarakinus TaxID=2747268 RepID=A0ABX7I144_9BACT|nr:OmpA family protein [Dyadobacter sandarakinus]QRQ99488.1 OmpA family protein [Dyadobacter sandarakinus]